MQVDEVSATSDPAPKWQPVAGADLKLQCPSGFQGDVRKQ